MADGRIPQALFALLRAGLWGEQVDGANCFPLSANDWNTLFQLAVEQTVEGLVFDGVQKLDSTLLPEKALLVKWLVRIEKTAQRNAWMNGIIKEQVSFFTARGLDPMLLKGQGLAACYRLPERRSCGDIDWYFANPFAYEKANYLIKDKGITVEYTPGFSSSYKWKECEVEHHSKMLDFYNPFCKSFLRHLEESEKSKRIEVIHGGALLSLPSPTMQTIQVNAHILKHVLSYGIGLRQLCDAARIYYTYHSLLDGLLLKKIYRQLRVLDWIYVLHEVLTTYIGLPAEYLPFKAPKKVSGQWMVDDILAGGNFGFYSKHGAAGEGTRNKKEIWQNVLKYFRYAPFEAISFPIVHFYSRFVR